MPGLLEGGLGGGADNRARSRWLANRSRWLEMTVEELEAERDEREARAKAADALRAEAEVHDDDAPYATANDKGLQAISGVSDEDNDGGSTPLVGKPREVEQGAEPDAELPDDATQAIVPTGCTERCRTDACDSCGCTCRPCG